MNNNLESETVKSTAYEEEEEKKKLTLSINLHQFLNQLFQLISFEIRQTCPPSTHCQSFTITIRSKETKLSINSTINFHSLKASRGIMQNICRWRKTQILIRTHFWCFPAISICPADCYHVIRAMCMRLLLFGSREGYLQ